MSQLTQEEVHALNKLLLKWQRGTMSKLKPAALGAASGIVNGIDIKINGEKKRVQGLHARNKRDVGGVIEGLGFKFPRFGVFVNMGIFGRPKLKERPLGSLKPKPWFNNTIESRFPILQKELGEKYEDFTISELKRSLLIKGQE